jgi:adenosylcobinamide-GDP ribazoletransferase
MPQWLRQPFSGLATALQFLTVMPPLVRRLFTAEELGRSVGYYPLVGGLLGLLLAMLDWGLAHLFTRAVSAALVLAAWVLFTGALHLDGFLDSCDGLLGGHTAEQRLAIMRDERVGAFGLAGGVLLLLVKYAALTAIPASGGMVPRPVALILAPVLGRWGMALAVWAFPYGRVEGLGHTIKAHTGRRELFLATAIALGSALLAAGWIGAVAMILATAVVGGVARFALVRLPGLTGDLYGAICEMAEAATLLLFALNLG